MPTQGLHPRLCEGYREEMSSLAGLGIERQTDGGEPIESLYAAWRKEGVLGGADNEGFCWISWANSLGSSR